MTAPSQHLVHPDRRLRHRRRRPDGVKELVFEKRALSLEQLREILRADWKGHEKLRLKMLHGKNKYGNGIEAVDFYAAALARYLGNKINLRPNGRGGFYIASMHTPPRYYYTFGLKTGRRPTADGRDEVSRNVSRPWHGRQRRDRAHQSVTAIDSAGHPAISPGRDAPSGDRGGRRGLAAMRTLLKHYMDRHGIAIQFNISTPDPPRRPGAPEKYQGLQCASAAGTCISRPLRAEQDLFIRRAQNISE